MKFLEYEIPRAQCDLEITGIDTFQMGADIYITPEYDPSKFPYGFRWLLDDDIKYNLVPRDEKIVIEGPEIGEHTVIIRPACSTDPCEVSTPYSFPITVYTPCVEPVSFAYNSRDDRNDTFTFDFQLPTGATMFDVEVTRPDGSTVIREYRVNPPTGSVVVSLAYSDPNKAVDKGTYRFRMRTVCDATNERYSNWSTPLYGTLGVFANLEIINTSQVYEEGNYRMYGDVVVKFYFDSHKQREIGVSNVAINYSETVTVGEGTPQTTNKSIVAPPERSSVAVIEEHALLTEMEIDIFPGPITTYEYRLEQSEDYRPASDPR